MSSESVVVVGTASDSLLATSLAGFLVAKRLLSALLRRSETTMELVSLFVRRNSGLETTD